MTDGAEEPADIITLKAELRRLQRRRFWSFRPAPAPVPLIPLPPHASRRLREQMFRDWLCRCISQYSD
jgi:hypothetical protein